VLIKYYLLVET